MGESPQSDRVECHWRSHWAASAMHPNVLPFTLANEYIRQWHPCVDRLPWLSILHAIGSENQCSAVNCDS